MISDEAQHAISPESLLINKLEQVIELAKYLKLDELAKQIQQQQTPSLTQHALFNHHLRSRSNSKDEHCDQDLQPSLKRARGD